MKESSQWPTNTQNTNKPTTLIKPSWYDKTETQCKVQTQSLLSQLSQFLPLYHENQKSIQIFRQKELVAQWDTSETFIMKHEQNSCYQVSRSPKCISQWRSWWTEQSVSPYFSLVFQFSVLSWSKLPSSWCSSTTSMWQDRYHPLDLSRSLSSLSPYRSLCSFPQVEPKLPPLRDSES